MKKKISDEKLQIINPRGGFIGRVIMMTDEEKKDIRKHIENIMAI